MWLTYSIPNIDICAYIFWYISEIYHTYVVVLTCCLQPCRGFPLLWSSLFRSNAISLLTSCVSRTVQSLIRQVEATQNLLHQMGLQHCHGPTGWLTYILQTWSHISLYNDIYILNYMLHIAGIDLIYDQLVDIQEISPTNDFYEISVPVTLPSRSGIYLQYPQPVTLPSRRGKYLQYPSDIAGIYHTYISKFSREVIRSNDFITTHYFPD